MQAIIRRAKKLNLCCKFDNKTKNPKTHRILKLLMAVPLLPADKIEEAIKFIQDLAYKLGKEQDNELKEQRKKPRYLPLWMKMFKYIRNEWLKKQGASLHQRISFATTH